MGSVAKVGAGQKEAQVGGKALERLLAFIEERRRRAEVSNEEGSEAFEREVRSRFAEAEREFVGEELEQNSSVLTADVPARCAGLAASDAGPGRQEPPGRTPVPSRCA